MSRFLKYCLGGLFLASLLTLPWIPLHNDDSAIYAVAIRNAVEFGQWLVPLISPGDLHSFLDKPPLGIWLQGLIPALFGVKLWSIHMMNVVVYGLMLVMFWFFVKRWSNRNVAALSTLIFGSNLAMVIYSRTTKMEMLLLLSLLGIHFLGYELLRNPLRWKLYILAGLTAAFGFLIKSGFAIILPVMTIAALMINPIFRHKIFKLKGLHIVLAALVFLITTSLVIFWQAASLGNVWPEYLASLFTTSKYNSAYIRVGFHIELLGLILAAMLPWSGLTLSAFSLQKLSRGWGLQSFAMSWLIGSTVFLLFFYGQADLRTIVLLVPALSILGGYRLQSIIEQRGRFLSTRIWTAILGILFGLFTLYVLISPVYTRPIEKTTLFAAALIVTLVQLALFNISKKYNSAVLKTAILILIVSIGGLFVFSGPIAALFNPYTAWPDAIHKYKTEGYAFVIYRPLDRPLKMSSDLCYLDFMAGPADRYITNNAILNRLLADDKVLVLVDSRVKNTEALPLKAVQQDKEQYLGINK